MHGAWCASYERKTPYYYKCTYSARSRARSCSRVDGTRPNITPPLGLTLEERKPVTLRARDLTLTYSPVAEWATCDRLWTCTVSIGLLSYLKR